jgi:hypothetical protein
MAPEHKELYGALHDNKKCKFIMTEPVGILTSGMTAASTAVAGLRDYGDIDTQIICHNRRRQQLQTTTAQLPHLSQAKQDLIRPAVQSLKDIQAAIPTELAHGTAKSRIKWNVAHKYGDLRHRGRLSETYLSIILSLLTSQCQDS